MYNENIKCVICTEKINEYIVKEIRKKISIRVYEKDEYTMSDDMDYVDGVCDLFCELKDITNVDYSCFCDGGICDITIWYTTKFDTEMYETIFERMLTSIFRKYKPVLTVV